MWPLDFFYTVIHIFTKVLGDAPFACEPATHNTFGKPLIFLAGNLLIEIIFC
jgi:hypothetical protein